MKEFEDIRPYKDEEINQALRRIADTNEFKSAIKYIFPEAPKGFIENEFRNISSNFELQKNFMHGGIRRIVVRSAKGLTWSGFEKLKAGEGYLFIANHRDIFLDSGILQILLLEHGLPTTEITFGSNLMANALIRDLGKSNKMFTVVRGGTRKEKYENTIVLSAYIRNAVTNEKNSIWIAQRAGRTKNGADITEPGVLKMLNMSGNGGFAEKFAELNIVPVTISYEYEPCAERKAAELFACKSAPYKKKPGEDLESILAGVLEYKGNIHLAIGDIINSELNEIENIPAENDRYRELAAVIDKQVYRDYRLWATNFIACDILSGEDKFSEKYSQAEKEEFVNYLENCLRKVAGDKSEIRKLILQIYANPIDLCYSVQPAS